MRRFACTLGSLALATFISAPALADCIPGTAICAGAGVGIPGLVQLGGQVSVGLPQIVLPPLPIPVVPAAPAPAYPVYPTYAPPQGYYPQQAPAPGCDYRARPAPAWGTSKVALDLRIDGSAGFGHGKYNNAYGLGGAGLGLRYRAFSHLGFEAGVDVLGGRDYNDDRRLEVAGTAGAILYFNPRSRVQVYLSGGALVDYAHATPTQGQVPSALFAPSSVSYTHVGGYGGLGLEMFATRHLAFHVDARGLARENVSGNADRSPEFTQPGTGRTTNTSAGLIGTAGMLLYF